MRLRKDLVKVSVPTTKLEPGMWFLRPEDENRFIYLTRQVFEEGQVSCLRYIHDGALTNKIYFNKEYVQVVGTFISEVWEADPAPKSEETPFGLKGLYLDQLEEYAALLLRHQKELEEQVNAHIAVAQLSHLGYSYAKVTGGEIYFYDLRSGRFVLKSGSEMKICSIPTQPGLEWKQGLSAIWQRRISFTVEPETRGGYVNKHGVRVPNPCGEIDMKGRNLNQFYRNVKPGDAWDDATIDRILGDPESV